MHVSTVIVFFQFLAAIGLGQIYDFVSILWLKCKVLVKTEENFTQISIFWDNIIIIIMGLESVSASEDVIGDLPSPWATINL